MPAPAKKRRQAGARQRSIVRHVADAIRRDALERNEGDLLGSEDDLIVRYGVSRPTLRQAAALLAQENLLVVRRGVGGGYFVRRPDSKAVAHVAAVYLRSRKTPVEEIVRSFAPIRIEVAKLAARSKDREGKERLRRFLEVESGRDQVTLGEFVRAEREFGRLMSELSGNPVISLFLEILYDCSAMLSPEEDIFRNHPDRVEEYRAKRNRLAAALIEGDEEIAVVAAARLASAAADWMMRDLARRSPTDRLVVVPSSAEDAGEAGAPRNKSPSRSVAEPRPRRAASGGRRAERK